LKTKETVSKVKMIWQKTGPSLDSNKIAADSQICCYNLRICGYK